MKTVGSLHVTLPSEREIALTRIFTAPRHLVYRAYTEPDLVRRWAAGPPGWRFAVCEIDLRVGGAWRWVLEGPGGERMGLGGVYREIVPNERLVSTERFDEAWYEGEAISRVTFHEERGETRLTVTVRYDSEAIRDAVLQSPMAEGMAHGLDQLESALKEL